MRHSSFSHQVFKDTAGLTKDATQLPWMEKDQCEPFCFSWRLFSQLLKRMERNS